MHFHRFVFHSEAAHNQTLPHVQALVDILDVLNRGQCPICFCDFKSYMPEAQPVGAGPERFARFRVSLRGIGHWATVGVKHFKGV